MLSRWYNYLFGSKAPLTPPAEPGKPAETNSDPLGTFQAQLKTKQVELFKELESWKKHREFEFSTASLALRHMVEHDPELHQKVTGIFSRMWGAIKKSLEPANLELDDLLKDAEPHLNELKELLNALCRSLKDKEKPDSVVTDEIKKIRIDMCDVSIIMLNELIPLINKVAQEIEYCLKFEENAEFITEETFDVVFRLILGLPIPPFNVDFKESYRRFLYDEILEEKEHLELDETELQGDLQKAERLLDELPAFARNPNSLFKAADAKNEAVIDVEKKIQAII